MRRRDDEQFGRGTISMSLPGYVHCGRNDWEGGPTLASVTVEATNP